MYGDCKKCDEDVSTLMDWDSLCEEYIECSNCGHRMTVKYDYSWDEESGEEDSWWWLEGYNG